MMSDKIKSSEKDLHLRSCGYRREKMMCWHQGHAILTPASKLGGWYMID